jgi:hypothetical protein
LPSPGIAGVKQVAAVNGRKGETMDELDNILSDEPATEAVETVEPVKEEQPRQPDGKFAPKGETESASPAPVEEPTLEHPALIGERRRRQEAEAERERLTKELEALRNPPAPPPSVFEDEQGWQQHFGSEVINTAVQQATFNSKLDMSEMMVRQANADFEDMKATFLELADQNPSLRQQALQDPHPWNKAYQIAKNHKAMQELAAVDVADLETKLRAKITAELGSQPTQQTLPNSLADSQSSRTSAGAVFQPPTLQEILGR